MNIRDLKTRAERELRKEPEGTQRHGDLVRFSRMVKKWTREHAALGELDKGTPEHEHTVELLKKLKRGIQSRMRPLGLVDAGPVDKA